MARTPSTRLEPAPDHTDTVAVENAMVAFDEENQRVEIMENRYGDERPYDLRRSIELIRVRVLDYAKAYLAIGLELLRIKEHEPRGDFLRILEEDLKMPRRTAQNMMAVALKYQGGLKALTTRLNVSKLLELATEEDDTLEQLVDGGTVAGLTLDEVDRMSVADLKKALRQTREDLQDAKNTATDQLLAKDKKINELDSRLSLRELRPKDWPRITGELLIQTQASAVDALQALDKLEQLRTTILTTDLGELSTEEQETATEPVAVTYLDALDQIWGQLGDLVDAGSEAFEGYRKRSTERIAQAELRRDAEVELTAHRPINAN